MTDNLQGGQGQYQTQNELRIRLGKNRKSSTWTEANFVKQQYQFATKCE